MVIMPRFAKILRAALPLAALLPLAACKPESAATAPETPPVAVRVIALAPVATAELRLSGALRAAQETPLAFRLTGEVVEKLVAAGDRVRAGAMLARLDDREQRRALEAAEAQRAAARVQAENAAREAARRETLLARGVLAAEPAERARTEAHAAAERLRAAQAEAERAALALEFTALRAPADGLVSEIALEVGQVIAAGLRVGLFAHDGPREAEVYIPEAQRADLPAEGEARLPGEAAPRPARLREVAALADAATRSFRARFVIEGLAPDAPVGGTLGVTLRRAEAAALRVPLSALAENGARPFLWRMAGGRVEAAPVRLLGLAGEDALIAAELPPGTPVVAFGVHRLTAGQAVRVLR